MRPRTSPVGRCLALAALGAPAALVVVMVASALPAPLPIGRVQQVRRATPAAPAEHPRTAPAPPPAIPGANHIDAARHYLESRAGVTGFAVIDSTGRLSGMNEHQTFITGSVVKAMLLVAYLDMLAREHRHLDAVAQRLLYPMIHVSDNNAATAVGRIVGDAGLYAVAHAAGMTEFSVSGNWGTALISPADQARLFFSLGRMIPSQFRNYAESLLEGIVSSESWGIPAVARPAGWSVLFKGGWRRTVRGQLVHQVAQLRRQQNGFALAVMTDGDPTMGYGIQTIQGVTSALLG